MLKNDFQQIRKFLEWPKLTLKHQGLTKTHIFYFCLFMIISNFKIQEVTSMQTVTYNSCKRYRENETQEAQGLGALLGKME